MAQLAQDTQQALLLIHVDYQDKMNLRLQADVLLQFPFVAYLDQAHALEHSLEVQLPFLQMTLDDFSLVPIVVGDCPAEQIALVLVVTVVF
jgi:AmmeMemoRadiSam system protein B